MFMIEIFDNGQCNLSVAISHSEKIGHHTVSHNAYSHNMRLHNNDTQKVCSILWQQCEAI